MRFTTSQKPHLTVGTSESSSRKFGRISGPRRLLVDAADAHSSSIPRSSEDDVDKLHDAHRDGRERDLETSVVRRLKVQCLFRQKRFVKQRMYLSWLLYLEPTRSILPTLHPTTKENRAL